MPSPEPVHEVPYPRDALCVAGAVRATPPGGLLLSPRRRLARVALVARIAGRPDVRVLPVERFDLWVLAPSRAAAMALLLNCGLPRGTWFRSTLPDEDPGALLLVHPAATPRTCPAFTAAVRAASAGQLFPLTVVWRDSLLL